MLTRDVAIVLLAAKKQNRGVVAKMMVKYGLYRANIEYMEDKGLVNVKEDNKVGLILKLTAEGYYQALHLLNTIYKK